MGRSEKPESAAWTAGSEMFSEPRRSMNGIAPTRVAQGTPFRARSSTDRPLEGKHRTDRSVRTARFCSPVGYAPSRCAMNTCSWQLPRLPQWGRNSEKPETTGMLWSVRPSARLRSADQKSSQSSEGIKGNESRQVSSLERSRLVCRSRTCWLRRVTTPPIFRGPQTKPQHSNECRALKRVYPPGTNKHRDPRSMCANSRRRRCPSTSNTQWHLACRISLPPVFTSRCWRLVNDQLLIRCDRPSRWQETFGAYASSATPAMCHPSRSGDGAQALSRRLKTNC